MPAFSPDSTWTRSSPMRKRVARTVAAALIIASAMLMRVEGGARLFGYPAFAMVLFLIAFSLGFGLVVSAQLRDRKAKPREERGAR